MKVMPAKVNWIQEAHVPVLCKATLQILLHKTKTFFFSRGRLPAHTLHHPSPHPLTASVMAVLITLFPTSLPALVTQCTSAT